MQNRSPNLRAVVVCAVLALIFSAALFSPQMRHLTLALIFLCVGVVLVMVTLSRRAMPVVIGELPVYRSPQKSPFRRWQAGFIVVGIGCLLMMAQGGSPPDTFWAISVPMRTDTQFLLFCAGVMCVALGLIGQPSKKWISGTVRSKWTLVAIILLAFAVRIVDLENQVHFFVDEMHFSNGIAHLWTDPFTPLFTPINYIASFAWLYPFLQKFSVDIFGANLTGLRMLSVVFGTLTIPAVYLLGRWLFDRPTGLLAALMLAIFPPHIHFSRLALNNIADPFFGTLALAMFARGLHTRDRASFVIAGVCLGMTQYFYEGGKLIFPATVVLWMLWALVTDRQKRRENLRLFGMMLATALLVILPLMMMLAAWNSPYIPRVENQTFAGEDWSEWRASGDTSTILNGYWTHQLLPSIAHLIYAPDASNFYYGGNTALILPMLLPAFFAGIGYVLWRRKIAMLLPLIVICLTVFGNSLIEHPGWSARYVVALPAIAVMMAVGLRVLWRFMVLAVSASPTRQTNAPSFREFIGIKRTGWIAPILIGLIAFVSVTYYFLPHLTAYNWQLREFRDHQDVGWRAHDLPEGTHVYLFTPEYVFMPHFQGMDLFWRDSVPITLVVDGQINFSLDEVERRVPLALFVTPEDAPLIFDLDGIFGLPAPQFSPYNVPEDRQYALYFLPAQDAEIDNSLP